MKYLDGQYYVEVKDLRYKILPSEIIIRSLRGTPKYLRTQYQNETQIRKNQKVVKIIRMN